MKKTLLLTTIIIIYCGWNASDLVTLGKIARLDRLDWIFFLIWFIPIPFYWFFADPNHKEGFSKNNFLLITAIAISLLGLLGSLHVMTHFALAMAFTALIPWFWQKWIWIACAISWMPSIAWLGAHFFLEYLWIVRFLLSVTSASFISYLIFKRGK
jgi:hypothetical protein